MIQREVIAFFLQGCVNPREMTKSFDVRAGGMSRGIVTKVAAGSHRW